jgi:hypothetical protein
MLLIVFLDLIATLTLVAGECNVGTQNISDFNYTEVSVRLLTGLMKEAAFKTIFSFPITKPQYSISDGLGSIY